MKNIAQLSVDNLVSSLGLIPEFMRKNWAVVDEDSLFHKGAQLKFPCAGVVYEGLRSSPSSEKAGKTSELVCSIYLLYQSGTIGGVDNKPKAIILLDAIRSKLLDTVSPSGHKWQFKFESPAEDMHKALVYYQRWATTVIL